MMKRLIILIQLIAIIILFYLTLTIPAAEAEKETKYFILEATGYYPGPECTYPFDDGFTAMGDVAGRGSIAIDDKNGPLRMGQMIWVESYGLGKCNDRGSAIKNWRIDLCFDTLQEAKNWGIKLVKVYVLDGKQMIYILLAIPIVGYLVGCYVERKLHDAVNEMARREWGEE